MQTTEMRKSVCVLTDSLVLGLKKFSSLSQEVLNSTGFLSVTKTVLMILTSENEIVWFVEKFPFVCVASVLKKVQRPV